MITTAIEKPLKYLRKLEVTSVHSFNMKILKLIMIEFKKSLYSKIYSPYTKLVKNESPRKITTIMIVRIKYSK